MNFLLDTHVFLWFIANDKQLSPKAKSLIESDQNSIFLSIASYWEITIKVSIGKLTLPTPLGTFLKGQLADNALQVLEIKTNHVDILASLPFHHRDPFDRLIIAQSLNENLPIIGGDIVFDKYGVQREW
jgi:PIN domain nuclease of toxin-antitoxin system